MNASTVPPRAVKYVVQALLCLGAFSQAASAAALILGDTTGNARGTDAVDIQSVRGDATQVAAGSWAMAIGQYNKATGDNAVSIGFENIAALESIAVGFMNNSTGLGYAFGYNNSILGGYSSMEYRPSAAFGVSNTVALGADFSFVFGRGNMVGASDATVFGSGITNSTANSTMIGPSDAAKVTILSSGNVGIGTATPTSKLHVVGDMNVTGSIINPMLGGSGSGSTSRLRVGGTVAPATAWQGTAIVGADGQNKVITGYLASSTNGAVIGAHNSALTGWADLNVAGANLIFRTSETERMRINSAGNVGIGVVSPTAKLHIAGGVYAQTASGQTFFHGHQVGSGYSNSQSIFTAQSDNPNGAQNYFFRGQIAGLTRFEVRADGRSYFGGEMGVGTTSLSGGVNDATNNNAITGKVQIFASGTDSTALFIKGNSTEYAGMKIKVGPGNVSGAADYYDITVRPSYDAGVNSGPDVSAIRINNTKPRTSPDVLLTKDGGNVGVGTATPAAKLDVNGAVQIAGDVKVKNNGVIRVSPAGDIGMGDFTSGTNPAN